MLSECVLVYNTLNIATALQQWATDTFEHVCWFDYEPVRYSDGCVLADAPITLLHACMQMNPNDQFGRMMVANLKVGCRLLAAAPQHCAVFCLEFRASTSDSSRCPSGTSL